MTPLHAVAAAILVTGLAALLLFGSGESLVGLAPDQFGSLVQLAVIGLLVASGLMFGRHRINARLWHAAVWLALLVGLMAGWQAFH